MRRMLLAALFLVVCAAPASAQAAQSLVYDYIGVTPATVATWTQTVKIDNVVQPNAPVCVAAGANTTCTVALAAPLSNGSHVFDITATQGSVSAQTVITGVNPTNAPKPASNARYNITININVP